MPGEAELTPWKRMVERSGTWSSNVPEETNAGILDIG